MAPAGVAYCLCYFCRDRTNRFGQVGVPRQPWLMTDCRGGVQEEEKSLAEFQIYSA